MEIITTETMSDFHFFVF